MLEETGIGIVYDIPDKENIKIINPLGIMEGKELVRLGYERAYSQATKIIDDH